MNKNPRQIFLLSSLLLSIPCFSQDVKTADVTDITKANFFDLGISTEKRIGSSQTLYAQAFLSTSIYIGYSSSFGNTSSVDIYPALTLQYRYYYNGPRRQEKDKRTEMNSMNYIALVSEATFYNENAYGQNKSRVQKVFGTAWGFQRNYPKRFSLDINLGIGYAFGKKLVISGVDDYSTISFGDFTTLGQVSLGFWLNKKK